MQRIETERAVRKTIEHLRRLDHFVVWLSNQEDPDADTLEYERDIAPAASLEFWVNIWLESRDIVGRVVSLEDNAIKLLRLSPEEGEALFDPLDDAPAVYCSDNRIYPMDAARVLEKFLETDVISWEGMANTCRDRDCQGCYPL